MSQTNSVKDPADVEKLVSVIQTFRDDEEQKSFRDWLLNGPEEMETAPSANRMPDKSDKWSGFGEYFSRRS
jgi:hypothetical protein